MDHSALTFLTDFGDQAVILPLVAAVALVLWAQRRWRVAAAWLLAIPGVLGTILILKVACYACGWLFPFLGAQGLHLRSPSGHAASAAVAYGGIAAMVASHRRIGAIPAAVAAAAVTALGVALLVGATRVQLGAHSLSEVTIAAVVGVAGAVAFTQLAGPRITDRSGLPVAAGALLVMVLFHGRHLPAESAIQQAASDMVRTIVSACQPG